MSHDLYETEVRPLALEIETRHADKSFAYRQGLFWRRLSEEAKRLMADNVYISVTRNGGRARAPAPKSQSSDVIRAAFIARFWNLELPDGTLMQDATAGQIRRTSAALADLVKGLKDNEKIFGKVDAEQGWNVWQRHGK